LYIDLINDQQLVHLGIISGMELISFVVLFILQSSNKNFYASVSLYHLCSWSITCKTFFPILCSWKAM